MMNYLVNAGLCWRATSLSLFLSLPRGPSPQTTRKALCCSTLLVVVEDSIDMNGGREPSEDDAISQSAFYKSVIYDPNVRASWEANVQRQQVNSCDSDVVNDLSF